MTSTLLEVPGVATGARTSYPPVRHELALVRIFILVTVASVLCSCADSKGFHPKRAASGDRDGFGHGTVHGSGDPPGLGI